MSWIYYLLEANLYLALFYAVYYLLLRHDTYYQLNRGYLLGSSMFAFIIPLLQLGILKPLPVVTQQITQVSFPTEIPVSTSVVNNVSVPEVNLNYYLVAYIFITILMAVSFGIRIFQLSRLASKGRRMAGKDFRLVEMEDEGRAFSFFSYLFISKKFTVSDTIIQHELVHIRQKHSLDIIYVELLKVMCWFNPAVYLLQNSIRELHEYIADSQVAINQQNINEYTDFLVSNAYGLPEPLLANSFFNKNLLKNRIMMLHQKRSGALARLKLLIALPLLAGMLCLSTLGFTKDYHVIDLLPARNLDSTMNFKMPPIPIGLPLTGVTSKGYSYQETWLLLPKNTMDFKVVIMEKDSSKYEYERNAANPAIIKHLKEKYGYNFPTQTAINKMPAIAELAPQNPKQPEPPKGIQREGHYMPPPVVSKDAYIGLENYMQRHYSYPAIAYKNKKTGVVVLDFVLDKKGLINDVKVAKGLGQGLDEEAIRLFVSYKKPIADKPGHHTLAIDWNIRDVIFTDVVPAKIKSQPNYAGEFYLPGNGSVPPNPKVERVRFPPPVLKPAAQVPAPPKPKVDQVRFPPPVLKADTGASKFNNLYTEIRKTIKWPKDALENNIQGRIFIRFNVDGNHHIIDLGILRGLSDSQNEEVIRALQLCTATAAMKPGINYNIPVFFALMEKSSSKYVKSEPYINPNSGLAIKPTGFPNVSLNEVIIVGYK